MLAMSDRPKATKHRPNGDPTTDPTGMMAMSVAKAAERLGISTEAVRMRLKRRTLPGDRDQAGHWRVSLRDRHRGSRGGRHHHPSHLTINASAPHLDHALR